MVVPAFAQDTHDPEAKKYSKKSPQPHKVTTV